MAALALITGVTVLALILAGAVWAVASVTSWRYSLGLWAFSAAVTAAAVVGAGLIAYGLEPQ